MFSGGAEDPAGPRARNTGAAHVRGEEEAATININPPGKEVTLISMWSVCGMLERAKEKLRAEDPSERGARGETASSAVRLDEVGNGNLGVPLLLPKMPRVSRFRVSLSASFPAKCVGVTRSRPGSVVERVH